MKFDYFFFDLDGTLTDPAMGITNSIMHALSYYGIHVTDRTSLYKYIGPPLLDTFGGGYGFSEDQAAEAVVRYREYYSDKGIFENTVYPEIPELLEAQMAAGKKLVLATSKPEEYAEQILKHFNLARYFTYIAGSLMDESRSRKSEVIKYAAEKCGITNMSQILMIGDRKHDICGAKESGTASLGVLYGYGSKSELETAGADFIAESVRDLQSKLSNL